MNSSTRKHTLQLNNQESAYGEGKMSSQVHIHGAPPNGGQVMVHTSNGKELEKPAFVVHRPVSEIDAHTRNFFTDCAPPLRITKTEPPPFGSFHYELSHEDYGSLCFIALTEKAGETEVQIGAWRNELNWKNADDAARKFWGLTDAKEYYARVIAAYCGSLPTAAPLLSEADAITELQIKDRFADLWIDRGWVRMKGYNMTQWLLDKDAPSWLTEKELHRHLAKTRSGHKVGKYYKR